MTKGVEPMEVDSAKLGKARQLRMEGRSIREAAKSAGISPTTLRKYERGWIDADGEVHGAWSADVGKAELARVAAAADASKTAAALLDRNERIRLHAEMASLMIDKVREYVPALKLKNAREAKQLMSEARELSKIIAQDQAGPGKELPPGVKQVVTLEDMKAHYARTRDITPSYIEPPEDPDAVPGLPGPSSVRAVPDAPSEAGGGRAAGRPASAGEAEEEEDYE
jgi:hypothetical protein